MAKSVIMEFQKELKEEAIRLGLCDKWQREWGTPDVDALCDKFIRGMDFCIKHDFPKVEYIHSHFNETDLHRNGIYTQGQCVSINKKHVVALGNCEVDVYVTENDICDIYARHTSSIDLYVGDNAFVYISTYDKCKIRVICKGNNARICVSKFGGTLYCGDNFDKIAIKK